MENQSHCLRQGTNLAFWGAVGVVVFSILSTIPSVAECSVYGRHLCRLATITGVFLLMYACKGKDMVSLLLVLVGKAASLICNLMSNFLVSDITDMHQGDSFSLSYYIVSTLYFIAVALTLWGWWRLWHSETFPARYGAMLMFWALIATGVIAPLIFIAQMPKELHIINSIIIFGAISLRVWAWWRIKTGVSADL